MERCAGRIRLDVRTYERTMLRAQRNSHLPVSVPGDDITNFSLRLGWNGKRARHFGVRKHHSGGRTAILSDVR